MIYIKSDIEHPVEVITLDNIIKILICKVKISNHIYYLIPATYKCHDLPESNFIEAILKTMTKNNNKFKRHFIIGDYLLQT